MIWDIFCGDIGFTCNRKMHYSLICVYECNYRHFFKSNKEVTSMSVSKSNKEVIMSFERIFKHALKDKFNAKLQP